MIKAYTLNITPELLGLVAEIDEFKGAWLSLGKLAPERLDALRRAATIASTGSSTRAEGSKLSDRDVEMLLANEQTKDFATRNEKEVAGYVEVLGRIFQSWADIDLTEDHIKQFHSDLLQYSEQGSRDRGDYKTASNSVAAFDEAGRQVGIIFETASPFETPALMAELVTWTNEALATKSLHPLLVIAVFIVVFLEIYPFQDGNERLSRVLTTLLLLRAGYAYVPYGSLDSLFEHSKQGYNMALRQTQGTIRAERPDWQPWLTYFARILLQQTRDLAQKVEQEKTVLSSLPQLSLQILEHAKQNGRVTITSMSTTTGANRNTLKKHLKALTDKGHLTLRGKARSSWYELP